MGDILQKVMPGQAMRMPAETYNRLMDMLRAWMGDSLGGGAGSAMGRKDLVTIRVENASGYDLEQYDILGLTQADQGTGGVWPKPADNLDAFCEGAVFTGHVPDLTKHVGRFAVVLEPVANGQMCRAAIAGVVPVYVSVQDEDDQWADINDGEYATLLSGKIGSAQLLFKEEGVGDKWCLARLGPPQPPRLLWCQIASGVPGDPPDERYFADEVRPQGVGESGHMAWEPVPGGLQGIVVHNVAEADAGSHTLPQGRVIHVEERLDCGNPPALVYLASVEPASAVQRLARIVSYDSGSYTVQPVLLGTGGLTDDGPQISGVPNLGELWPEEAGYLDGPAGYDRYVELLGGSGGYAFILHPPRMV